MTELALHFCRMAPEAHILPLQEVTVAARKSREDMRQLAMSIVANMVEAEAEA